MAPGRTFTCPVCMEDRCGLHLHYRCDHFVCNLCCGEWRKRGGHNCPLCRAPDKRQDRVNRRIVIVNVSQELTLEEVEAFAETFEPGTRIILLRL